jgi:hypothetical protein
MHYGFTLSDWLGIAVEITAWIVFSAVVVYLSVRLTRRNSGKGRTS